MSTPDDEPTAAVEPADPVAGPAPRAHRSRRPIALLTAALLAVVAGATAIELRGAPAPSAAPGRPTSVSPTTTPPQLRATPDADQRRVSALQALLAARSRAVLGADKRAWLATIDPQATAFRQRQAQVFDNLRSVPFSDFSYEFDGVAGPLSTARRRQLGPTAWVARVVADYRIQGYDRSPSQTEQYLTSVQRAGHWYLTADTGGATDPQLWDLGRVGVVRGAHVLVIGTADASTLRSYVAQGDAAIERVTRVWGENWPRRAVLVVPSTQEQMGQLLKRADGLDQIAAVTVGELSSDGSGAAGSDRVVINPSAFARLGVTGRRVVLTHELTHVAVRGSTPAAVPIWLSEGFADYVGYQGVDLGRRTVAADELALVRQGEGFTRLPVVDDFDPSRTTIAPAYSAAWLACSLIADRYGQQALVRLYRTTATSRDNDPDRALSQAFHTVLGTSQAAFTKSWLAYMSQLAAP